MKKKHALHNEKLSNFLLSDGGYNDWVVTTAFYSALHYVQNEIFPLTEATETYIDLNQYYSRVIKKKKLKTNKHLTAVFLVSKKLKAAHPSYKWLYDACMNSRYNNYVVSKAKATQAIVCLNTIKSTCLK